MSYSDVADIQAEFRSIKINDDSAVTEESVESFIAQADAEIDSMIGTRYAVPVSGESALLVLKQISVWLVARRVKDVLEIKNVRPEVDQDIKTDTRSMALSMLNKIVNGEMNLIGATLANSVQGVKSGVSANNIERTFKRNTDQW